MRRFIPIGGEHATVSPSLHLAPRCRLHQYNCPLFLIELQQSLRGESNRILSQENVELLLREVKRDYSLGFDLWTLRGQPYFGHSGANDGFRCRMVAHRTGGFGVVILTNSDNGSELSDAVVRVIGEREGWPGF